MLRSADGVKVIKNQIFKKWLQKFGKSKFITLFMPL